MCDQGFLARDAGFWLCSSACMAERTFCNDFYHQRATTYSWIFSMCIVDCLVNSWRSYGLYQQPVRALSLFKTCVYVHACSDLLARYDCGDPLRLPLPHRAFIGFCVSARTAMPCRM